MSSVSRELMRVEFCNQILSTRREVWSKGIHENLYVDISYYSNGGRVTNQHDTRLVGGDTHNSRDVAPFLISHATTITDRLKLRSVLLHDDEGHVLV